MNMIDKSAEFGLMVENALALAAELAQAQARIIELSDLQPQTLKQRVQELEADLADSRLIAREQEDAHVAAKMRIRDLEEYPAPLARALARIEDLEAALTRLTDGYKYSTEVCTIAREALSSCQPGYVEEQRGGATIRHSSWNACEQSTSGAARDLMAGEKLHLARIAALEAAAKAVLAYYADERNDESWHPEFQALRDCFALEMPADYTIDGDGVWMGGKWHPSGGPKSETRMIQVLDPELSAMPHPLSGALDAPTLWLNTRDKTYWADANELRAWRSAHTSGADK
jgi:hypothetical protein